jgi:hypothetical protein
MYLMEYLTDVNKLGQKTVIVKGEDNIIIPPHKTECKERLDAARFAYE